MHYQNPGGTLDYKIDGGVPPKILAFKISETRCCEKYTLPETISIVFKPIPNPQINVICNIYSNI